MINKFYDFNFLGNSQGCTLQDIQQKHFVSTTLHLLLYNSPQMPHISVYGNLMEMPLYKFSGKHTTLQIYLYVISTNC